MPVVRERDCSHRPCNRGYVCCPSDDDGKIRPSAGSLIIKDSAMTPYEMEEQIKNLDARTTAIERILPTLATKDDLRLTTEALQHEMAKLATKDELNAGLDDAKRYALMLNEATRDDIRLLAEHMLAMRSQLDRIEGRRN